MEPHPDKQKANEASDILYYSFRVCLDLEKLEGKKKIEKYLFFYCLI